MQTEIYYIEDDIDIASLVKTYLERWNYKVSIYSLLSQAKQALNRKMPAMILIDWNLRDGSGDSMCTWIRRHFGEKVPILFLTVRGETEDIVKGFQNGADDYLVKPFALEVLLARIQAILKRVGEVNEKHRELYCGDIRLDKDKIAVYYKEKEVALSQSEYRVLLYLMEQKGKTVKRQKLLEEVWDIDGNFVNDNTLTVTIKRLREKFGNPAYIKTIRSFGYRMEENNEE